MAQQMFHFLHQKAWHDHPHAIFDPCYVQLRLELKKNSHHCHRHGVFIIRYLLPFLQLGQVRVSTVGSRE
eukprot:2645618-Ditylum_brightwellii.AAC.1